MEFDAVLLPPRRARMVAQGLWHDRTINAELDACAAARPQQLALTAVQVETGDVRRFSYGEMAQMADRILVLRGGLLVEEGPAARILAAPRHAYTRALLAAVPKDPENMALPAPRGTPARRPWSGRRTREGCRACPREPAQTFRTGLRSSP